MTELKAGANASKCLRADDVDGSPVSPSLVCWLASIVRNEFHSAN